MSDLPEPPRPGGTDGDRQFRTEHLQHDIARRSIRGGAVTLGSQVIKVAAQFATVVLLARLLSPSDFGVFAMVATLLIVLEIFKDLGLSGATVQRPDLNGGQVSTLFWLNVGLGTAAAALLAVAAPGLAWVYDEPALIEITPPVSLTLILTGMAAQHLALLRRQMRFTALAAILTSAELVAMVAAVTAALAGLGLWALVVQRLTWGATLALGGWIASGWVPGRPARIGEVRSMVAFGGNTTAAMLLGRCATSFDKFLIGWYWGAAPLGLFVQSQKLIMMPIQNINTPLAAVALPLLSRLVDQPQRYRKAYVTATERVAMVVAPLAGLITAAGGEVVEFLLGAQWHEAGPILSWMGITAIYMPVTYTLSWLYMSQDRTGEMLRASMVNVSVSLTAVLIALPMGPAAIAAAYAVSGALVRAPILFWLAGRRGPVGTLDIARLLVLPSLAATAAGLVVEGLGRIEAVAALPGAVLMIVYAASAVLAAIAVYGVAPRGRSAIAETLQLPRLLLQRSSQA